MADTLHQVDISALAAQLQAVGAAVSKIDLSKPLGIIGQMLVSDAQQAFARMTGPDGKAWPPLKNPSKRRGGPSAKPLRNTGRLMGSMTSRVRNGLVEIGTNLRSAKRYPFPAVHQFGSKFVPQRKFLGIPPKRNTAIRQVVLGSVAEQLRGLIR